MNRNYYYTEEISIYQEVIDICIENKCIKESLEDFYSGSYESSFELKSCGYRYDEWGFAA